MWFLGLEDELGVVGHYLAEQRRSTLEVEVELALADSCVLDHVVEARLRDAAFADQSRGGGDDAAAGRASLGRSRGLGHFTEL